MSSYLYVILPFDDGVWPDHVTNTAMPMATKLGRMLTLVKRFLTIKLLDSLSHGLAGSINKLKPLYLHYYSVYDHQTWHYVDLP